MLTLANVLALALIADGPAPPAPKPAGSLEIPARVIILGPLAIPITGFEPEVSKTPAADVPELPKIVRPRTGPDPEPEQIWHLSLADAIRIGLENSEVIRVCPREAKPGSGPEPASQGKGRDGNRADVVIARLNADASIWNFKAAAMVHVRSIEQQYWALSLHQVQMWSCETAVRIGEEILAREKAELEHGKATAVTVAEAEQQVENFKLNLVSAVSDVITTERQLRNILGLPVSDGRRIVPETAPTEAKVEPDWEASLVQMRSSQPDIAQQQAQVWLMELELAVARDRLLPAARPDALQERLGMPVGLVGAVALVDPDQAEHQLARQRAFLQQIIHQTTHSLARFFLEVDANYKQFRTAQRLRAAAQKRLEAQRALHEEGGLTIDRLLDAVGQYANAIAQEAQFKTSYNTSIAALEEAKGTLLAYDGITVLEHAPPGEDRRPKDAQVAPAAFQSPAPKVESPKPAPTTYKVRARVGSLLIEAEVEVNRGSPAKPDR